MKLNDMVGLIARIGFAWVKWKSRHGIRTEGPSVDAKKRNALQTGVRGETYAYWYLRRLGYVFIARNYMPLRAKGELDLVGFDGDTLAIVEVRALLAEKDKPALPEMSITAEKHETLVRTAHYFLRERHIEKCPVRFDVVGIDVVSGKQPVVRVHKAALNPEGPRFH